MCGHFLSWAAAAAIPSLFFLGPRAEYLMSILPTASNKQIHFEVAFRYDAQHVGEIAFFRASVVKGERVSRKKRHEGETEWRRGASWLF